MQLELKSMRAIVSLQETKSESFDPTYIKKFCPKHLSSFAFFFPSDGASGGIITIWNKNIFTGTTVQANASCVTVKFINNLDNNCFFLSNIYGPSHAAGKLAFVTWFLNLDTSTFDDWIIAGDFNMYRSVEDRNKPGGDAGEMQMFTSFLTLNFWKSLSVAKLLPGAICN
jgi:hypothetical protein